MATQNTQSQNSGCTISLGGIVAALMSWKLNASVLWCIFHLFCGWAYVLYAFLFRFDEIKVWFR
jgi:hypothetical protein